MKKFNRWNDVITQSKKTMKKLPICNFRINPMDATRNPYGIRRQDLHSLLSSERKFSSIVIKDSFGHSRAVLEKFLSIRGQSVLCLEINSNMHHRSLEKTLKHLPNVENLTLNLDFLLSERVKLRKLKSLRILATSHEMLQIIEAPKLVELKLSGSYDDKRKIDIIAFLIKSVKLQKLSVAQGLEILKLEGIENCSFKLKVLEMTGSINKEEAHKGQRSSVLTREEIFSKFLKQQEKSLTKIIIQPGNCDLIYKQILTWSNNLNYLCFDCSKLPQKESFYLHLKPLKNIRTLRIITHDFECFEVVVAFHSLFPQIETLICRDDFIVPSYLNYLEIMADLHPNLETLIIYHFAALCGNFRFKNLKTLIFGNINKAGVELILKHPTLENLSFGHPYLSLPSSSNVRRLQALPNLKTIEVQGPLHSVKKYYKICKSDYKNLSKASFRIAYRDPLFIEIPTNRKYWNTDIKKQYFKK